jgi:hypothetical protein
VPAAARTSEQTQGLEPWAPEPLAWPAVLRALPEADRIFAEVGWR